MGHISIPIRHLRRRILNISQTRGLAKPLDLWLFDLSPSATRKLEVSLRIDFPFVLVNCGLRLYQWLKSTNMNTFQTAPEIGENVSSRERQLNKLTRLIRRRSRDAGVHVRMTAWLESHG